MPKAGMERTSKVLAAVHEERVHQDKKWGVQEHEPERWFTILLEELGEAAKARLEMDSTGYRAEMVSVAAVVVAAIEQFDREAEPGSNQVVIDRDPLRRD